MVFKDWKHKKYITSSSSSKSLLRLLQKAHGPIADKESALIVLKLVQEFVHQQDLTHQRY